MTFQQMIIEMKARGFEHMGSRVESYLNDSYLLDIAEGEDWPWLEEAKEGTAPLTISDLRTVRFVVDQANVEQLTPLREDRIVDSWNPDLTTVGTPELYYRTGNSTIRVYPVSTATLEVHYWKIAPELSGEAEPLMPKRWHSLIIDGAVARAYEQSDDYELATAARQAFEQRLQLMRESLLNPQHDAPDDGVVVEDPYALR